MKRIVEAFSSCLSFRACAVELAGAYIDMAVINSVESSCSRGGNGIRIATILGEEALGRDRISTEPALAEEMMMATPVPVLDLGGGRGGCGCITLGRPWRLTLVIRFVDFFWVFLWGLRGGPFMNTSNPCCFRPCLHCRAARLSMGWLISCMKVIVFLIFLMYSARRLPIWNPEWAVIPVLPIFIWAKRDVWGSAGQGII